MQILNNRPFPRRCCLCKETTTPHTLVDRKNAPSATLARSDGEAEMPPRCPCRADTQNTRLNTPARSGMCHTCQNGRTTCRIRPERAKALRKEQKKHTPRALQTSPSQAGQADPLTPLPQGEKKGAHPPMEHGRKRRPKPPLPTGRKKGGKT